MNRFELDSARLDATCEAFVQKFACGEETGTGRRAYMEKPTDQGLVSIVLTYRDRGQQLRDFETASSKDLGVHGNPSAIVDTYSGSASPNRPEGVLAVRASARLGLYKHDRDTGLVVVNDYGFPRGDTRPLDDTDRRALDESIATGGMYDPDIRRRVLTLQGMCRLILTLEQCM